MGRKSRDKGKRGEREVVHIFRERGWQADRFGHAQTNPELHVPDVKASPDGKDTWYIEVKRRKTLADYLVSFANMDAKGRRIALIRADRGPWFVVMELETFFELVGGNDEG